MTGITKSTTRYSTAGQAIAGWTFVEMLVAIALSSVCLGAGALALQSISVNSKRTTSIVEIDIGETRNMNFYGNTGGKLRTYMAPNFGKIMHAQELREKMAEDALRSTGIYCLARSESNSIRPLTLSYPGGTAYREKLDSTEAFRSFLAQVEPTSSAIFSEAVRTAPSTSSPHASIFMLGPSNDLDEIRVNAIYELDLVTPSNRNGTYASVRRYVDGNLTHYYDIFYDTGDGDAFHPAWVHFEHRSRRIAGEGTDLQRFQIARRSPFYIVWLPDPSINPYKKSAWTPKDPASMARSTYEHMSGKTSFTIVLPMFPSL